MIMAPQEKNFEGSRSPDRLEAFAGLLGDVSMLISELSNNQESRQADNTFTFEIIGDHHVVLPPQVLSLLPSVDQVVVTIGKEELPKPDDEQSDEKSSPSIPPYLSINFLSKDALISASRSIDAKDPNEPDVFLDLSSKSEFTPVPFRPLAASEYINREADDDFSERRIEIGKISQKDINTLLMSLIYPDAERGYEMFENVDILRADTFDTLMDSFRLASLGHHNSVMHAFSTGPTRFNFNKQEGQPVSFSIYYNDTVNGEAEAGRPIIASSNMETDFRLEFRTYEQQEEPLTGRTRRGANIALGSVKVESTKPYFPTTQELQLLRSILIKEILAINPTSVPIFEDTLTDNVGPEQSFEKSGKADTIFSPSYIKKMLSELGFDSPDSGTA